MTAEQGFSISALLASRAGEPSAVGGCPGRGGALGSVESLHPLDTSSSAPPPSLNNQKCLQTWPGVS